MARNQRSGRGSGRGRSSGRGFQRSRSKSRNRNWDSNKNSKTEHKTGNLEMKFATQGHGKAQATVAAVKEHLQHHLQLKLEKGDDIVISIESMELLDMDSLIPVRKQSKLTKEEERTFQQKDFDYLHEQKVKKYMARVELFEWNLRNTHTIIYQKYCTDGMKDCLDRDPTFETKLKKTGCTFSSDTNIHARRSPHAAVHDFNQGLDQPSIQRCAIR
jgi:hypothetical protein